MRSAIRVPEGENAGFIEFPTVSALSRFWLRPHNHPGAVLVSLYFDHSRQQSVPYSIFTPLGPDVGPIQVQKPVRARNS